MDCRRGSPRAEGGSGRTQTFPDNQILALSDILQFLGIFITSKASL